MTIRSDERREFLAGIISTAVEGGIGYWAEMRNYTWGTDQGRHCLEGTGAFAVVEVNVKGKWTKVNIDMVAHGIVALKAGEFQVNHTLKGNILAADTDNDASEIDTEAADVIVQAALFGELVYG